MIPLARDPERPSRFRLARAGIHQVWQYDDEFSFGDGRLLLRGKNGAGKSKALEVLLPFLLDGDTRRIDASGGAKTSLKWLMLDGWTEGTNRLGYLWATFTRVDDEGEPRAAHAGGRDQGLGVHRRGQGRVLRHYPRSRRRAAAARPGPPPVPGAGPRSRRT